MVEVAAGDIYCAADNCACRGTTLSADTGRNAGLFMVGVAPGAPLADAEYGEEGF